MNLFKCFPWLLRHRKRGSGTLCGNILWLKVVFFWTEKGGTEMGLAGVSFKSHSLIGAEQGDTSKNKVGCVAGVEYSDGSQCADLGPLGRS